MNAIVDVYLDNNLGDDIMGEMLIRHLQSEGIKCYILAKNKFTYMNFMKNIDDVEIIESLTDKELEEKNIDVYVRIGGSMFQHNSIKEGVLRYKALFSYKRLKRKGIRVYILGCNVGPFYSKVGIRATKNIIKLTDMVTCRDIEAFSFIKKIKSKDCYIFPDVVFSNDQIKGHSLKEDILGVSTYTGYTNKLKNVNYDYCSLMINIINKYLEEKPNSKVKLFAFDGGYNSDYPTTFNILDNIKNKERVEIVGYTGDIPKFLEEYRKCSVMIGTRFHSIVLSLMFKTPILPVVYSNKTNNLLDGLKYEGPKIDISNISEVNLDKLVCSIIEKKDLLTQSEKQLFSDAEGHFKMLSQYIKKQQIN